MKVSQVRKLVKVTIELESEEELSCLVYLTWVSAESGAGSLRKGRLDALGLKDEDIRAFQHKLGMGLRGEEF